MTREHIRSKLDILRENFERLAQIPQSTYEEFASDFRNVDSAKHRLQTSIQALMDFGGYLVAQLGLEAPRTSHEILERLEATGHLPVGAADRFRPIFGFRNRVVHLYDRVDPQIVYAILRECRTDLEELLGLFLAIDQAVRPPAS